MSTCAIASCTNYYRKTRTLSNEVVYHKFPNDSDTCKLWISKCKRQDTFNYKNARICSEHFTSEDYEDDMKNRLLGLPQKRKLKYSSVPSLNLPSSKDNQNIAGIAQDRNKRITMRRIRSDALQRIQNISPKKKKIEINSLDTETAHDFDLTLAPGCSKCYEFNTKVIENIHLNTEIKKLKDELNSLKNKRKEYLRIYKRKIKYYTTSLKRKNREFKELKRAFVSIKQNLNHQTETINGVKTILTPGQIKSLSRKGQVRWASEDISRCVMLRALSRKAYHYLRENIKFPLPSPATLSRWCSKFTCFPGILDNVISLVKRCCENLPESDKLCVLSFDEMHVDSRIEYSLAMDQIVGPHSKVQVVLIRGLCAKWKQPVYFDFDVTMKKELLFRIIDAVEVAGVKVCAIVSDLGGCGTLWKELNISIEVTSFTNPSDPTRNVWVFADMPHYIKLLRNHLLDEGIILEDGTEVNVDILKEILIKDKGEIKLCHKLDPSILTLRGNERQKVAPAKAIFQGQLQKRSKF